MGIDTLTGINKENRTALNTQIKPLRPDAVTAQPHRHTRKKKPRRWPALLLCLAVLAAAGYYYRGIEEQPVANIAVVLGCLKFMWDMRHPKG